jgi:large subunit ribosomal protein L30e
VPENLELQKQLKLASKTGSYVVGRREVSNAIKGTKLLVWSASANVPQTILDECRKLSVPALKFSGNSVELGRACGIPFRVSVIAVRAVGDADLSEFASSSDYHSGSMVVSKPETTVEEPKETEKAKVKKESKKKDETDKPATKAKKSAVEKKKDSDKVKSPKKSEKETKDSKPKKVAKKKKSDDEE